MRKAATGRRRSEAGDHRGATGRDGRQRPLHPQPRCPQLPRPNVRTGRPRGKRHAARRAQPQLAGRPIGREGVCAHRHADPRNRSRLIPHPPARSSVLPGHTLRLARLKTSAADTSHAVTSPAFNPATSIWRQPTRRFRNAQWAGRRGCFSLTPAAAAVVAAGRAAGAAARCKWTDSRFGIDGRLGCCVPISTRSGPGAVCLRGGLPGRGSLPVAWCHHVMGLRQRREPVLRPCPLEFRPSAGAVRNHLIRRTALEGGR